ncbi:phage tail tape measure protein [Streptomyces sp. NBC_01201]|uniref:phage tail tape measure protein n=1 Tax=unclassified Streptomyces TaxID=2593676 RepID=UPI002E0EC7F6|nr:phage tail tape measure protein [Streptomyces sp. NBC_01213]WSQ82803.1 phage tail tape measure protein [Streptomyces sp. NBC_01213]WSR50936.1 phage tail tape measure protein [Streptomyces sp. NBC_01201]
MATLEELLVSVGINTDDLTSGAQGAADDVGASLGGIGALGAGAAVGGLFAMGLANAMDASAANTKLANQLGLSEQEAARAGDVAGAVFSAGFGESIGGVNEGIQAVVSSIGGMSELTDAELQSMTTSALMLADTFELDVADAAQAAGAMISNGLVKDGAEAFDVLTVAAQNLPKQMLADIPATVNEYGKHWSRIGLDAQTAMGMMSQYVQAGGRDIDQAGDVLHEFARITSEETDKASAAFKGLGLNSKEMLADIHKGGEPAKAALQKTIEALRGVKDQGTQSALAVELFGDMAGEGADALWAMDPATAASSNGMQDVKGAAEAANAAMAASPAQSMESIMRTLATTLGEMLGPALKVVGDILKEHPNLIKILVPILAGLALAIGIAVIAQWAWNTALWAFPGTWIIAGIIALIAIIVLIVVYWDEIAAATGRAWDWITGKLGEAWSWITSKLGAAWDWVAQKTSEAWQWVQQKVAGAIAAVMQRVQTLASIPGKVSAWFSDVVSWISGLPGRISRAASGMWDGISRSFRSMVNQLISGWNNLSFTIGGGSIMGVSIPSLTLSTPNIPMLAEGGVTTGPTLAMIGEGAEQETVLPLSKLDGMLRSVAGSVRETGGSGRGEVRITLDATGGSSALRTALQEIVRIEAGGDVQSAFGQ